MLGRESRVLKEIHQSLENNNNKAMKKKRVGRYSCGGGEAFEEVSYY